MALLFSLRPSSIHCYCYIFIIIIYSDVIHSIIAWLWSHFITEISIVDGQLGEGGVGWNLASLECGGGEDCAACVSFESAVNSGHVMLLAYFLCFV